MNRRTVALWAFAPLVLTVGLLAAACGGDDDSSAGGTMPHGGGAAAPAGSITVQLTNWSVAPATASVPAGKVTFWAVHDMSHGHAVSEGGVTHDLQVFRKLSNGSMELVGQVNGLKIGEAKALTLDLATGEYELACNVVEEISGKQISHYAQGMHTSFTVA